MNAATWRIGPDRELSLDRPRLMGILNATPDSFSDGGRAMTVEAALTVAMRLIEDGADMIDIGGESTRPGAERIDAQEQIRRTVPVIKAVRRQNSRIALSIDTTLSPVARAALDAGADIVNDVAAGLDDDAMLPLCAQRRCGVVLMHRLRPPERDSYSHEYAVAPQYGDVVAEVAAFLSERAAAAERIGIARDTIAVDPGLGFGKSVEQNLTLINRSSEFVQLGRPVLVGASRKSFIGVVTAVQSPDRRLAGSIAAALAMFEAGVRLFRVHDVAPHREALAFAQALFQQRG